MIPNHTLIFLLITFYGIPNRIQCHFVKLISYFLYFSNKNIEKNDVIGNLFS